ncbi:nuclease-related domain-containing protein [Thalassobacillus sp. CUG 92003]|uniref:nuclease-related domain-containing protein n=1 Tax=Thalassobacillus sp. CUG 92003 TaxID=2736641 RepID=UPI0015E77C54|nr:nuclease-related domain-containing protein [Thalassobacillus sp. CUG 92003]
MIVKPLTFPRSIAQIEALLRRLPPTHPMQAPLNENLSRRRTGYLGEQQLKYPLSLLPEEDYLIFHDLRLFDGVHYFQIDTLLLSRRFFLIIEVKNISGTLYFDRDFNQVIRTLDDKKEKFNDPVLQAEQQGFHLNKWLAQQSSANVPIECIVAISSQKAILETPSRQNDTHDKVIHAINLPFAINKLASLHQTEHSTVESLQRISKVLLKAHTPLQRDLLHQSNILKQELTMGVQCERCQHMPMLQQSGKWQCPYCQKTSVEAHLYALQDYTLLLDTSISNVRCQDFLCIQSATVAKKILRACALRSIGANKGRTYYVTYEHLTELAH